MEATEGRTYILEHDGDHWLLRTPGDVTLPDLARDTTTVFMCVCYTSDRYSLAADEGRAPTAARLAETAEFLSEVHKPGRPGEAPLGLSRRRAEKYVEDSLRDRMLKVYDPLRVGSAGAEVGEGLIPPE